MRRARRLSCDEAGYLWEIPLLVIFVAVVAAVIGPLLPRTGRIVLLAVLASVVLGFLLYNFVFPGWLPGRKRRR